MDKYEKKKEYMVEQKEQEESREQGKEGSRNSNKM